MSYYGTGETNPSNAGGYYGQSQNAYGGSSQQYGGTNQQFGAEQQQQQQQQYGYQGSYGNSSGWSQQHQQQPQQHQTYGAGQFMQPQQQPQAVATTAAPTYWNPSAAASMAAMAASTMASGGTLSNDAMLDFANAAGKSFLQSGTAQMIPGLESTMMTLRSYFAVDNKYVIKKIKRFLLPILSDKHGWQRQVSFYFQL
jgi:YIF1